jgi:hypothetical protein
MDGKINFLNEKCDFSAAKIILNYLGKIAGNLVNDFDIFKFVIAVGGNHCWHSTRVPPDSITELKYITN